MERGASTLLAARAAQSQGRDPVDAGRAVPGRGGRLRGALAGLGDTCALACVALLGCLALIALGTVSSLLWMLIAER
jgi:hypothetical protein